MNTYRIEELDTTGWVMVEKYEKLPRDKAKQVVDQLIVDGYNPNRLRVVVDGTTQ